MSQGSETVRLAGTAMRRVVRNPMGSISMIAVGAAALVASFVLLQHVRPREGRPTPAWARSDSMSTIIALGLVVGLVFGLSLIIAGALG